MCNNYHVGCLYIRTSRIPTGLPSMNQQEVQSKAEMFCSALDQLSLLCYQSCELCSKLVHKLAFQITNHSIMLCRGCPMGKRNLLLNKRLRNWVLLSSVIHKTAGRCLSKAKSKGNTDRISYSLARGLLMNDTTTTVTASLKTDKCSEVLHFFRILY